MTETIGFEPTSEFMRFLRTYPVDAIETITDIVDSFLPGSVKLDHKRSLWSGKNILRGGSIKIGNYEYSIYMQEKRAVTKISMYFQDIKVNHQVVSPDYWLDRLKKDVLINMPYANPEIIFDYES